MKLWDTGLIALASVLAASIEWQIAEPMGFIWRLILSLLVGCMLAAVLIVINIKTRDKDGK
jgi:hypothetical protein